MVYFDAASGKEVLFPRVRPGKVEGVEFVNQTTKKSAYKEGKNTSNSSFYYSIELDLSDLPNGQYDYFIYSTNKEELLANGICQCGDFMPIKKEYSTDMNYKQYRNE